MFELLASRYPYQHLAGTEGKNVTEQDDNAATEQRRQCASHTAVLFTHRKHDGIVPTSEMSVDQAKDDVV